ncbi:MAG TPA: hypothetical protein VJ983_11200, partial [candidate division Zixibacteria bacterium]|nr:hypothetical protein [candidate division Zixibacteria bacterium]
MATHGLLRSIVLSGLCLLFSHQVFARAEFDGPGGKENLRARSTANPALAIVAHRIGKIVLAVNNNGTFGRGFAGGVPQDFFTGEAVPSLEYPKGSNIGYLFAGAFWIGAVVGRDTLVSVGADGWSYTQEFHPDAAPFGYPVRRSITFPDSPGYENAVSEEDYIMKYTDTLTEGIGNDYFGRPHIPLDIEVTERSYAWSYSYAEDFVLFDYTVKNIGNSLLRDVYMGLYVDADVYFQGGSSSGYNDDICGFIEKYDIKEGQYVIPQTVNIAWIADNDGDPVGGRFNQQSPTAVTGMRIIRTPADTLDVSFNWWISNGNSALDFGPRERPYVGRLKEAFRDFRTGGLGTPEGDVNKYYLMRNREFDYDQPFSGSIQPTDTLWMTPPQENASNYADGFDTRFLLSFGPFDINPGEKLPLSFAYVAGDSFHVNPYNIDNLPGNAQAYYDGLNFTDLAKNSSWAAKVYDNPGIDTDSDGYAGKYKVFCTDTTFVPVDTNIGGHDTTIIVPDYNRCDTVYYEGDGVPDFRGAAPPPAPQMWLYPELGTIKVRFNGFRSETAKDVFSRAVDFEGYRVYIGRDERASSYSLVASYDKEDYNRYVWDDGLRPSPGYVLLDAPFTIDSLRCLYGASCDDSTFNPLSYTRNAPFIGDSIIAYFEPQDYNASILGVSTPIKRTYPNQPYPSSLNKDSVDASELTEDGYFKYFEYELDIPNLLPSVPYWVNVTAFDFGSPESGLASLESSVTTGAKSAYPLSSASKNSRLSKQI